MPEMNTGMRLPTFGRRGSIDLTLDSNPKPRNPNPSFAALQIATASPKRPLLFSSRVPTWSGSGVRQKQQRCPPCCCARPCCCQICVTTSCCVFCLFFWLLPFWWCQRHHLCRVQQQQHHQHHQLLFSPCLVVVVVVVKVVVVSLVFLFRYVTRVSGVLGLGRMRRRWWCRTGCFTR